VLIKAVLLVAEWTVPECLDAYEGTTDAMVKSVCQWRLVAPDDFARLVALVQTPVAIRNAAAPTSAPVPLVKKTGTVQDHVLRALGERDKWPTADLAAYCGCLNASVRIAVYKLRKAGHVIGGPAGGGYYANT
jgi:hypothetical protein